MGVVSSGILGNPDYGSGALRKCSIIRINGWVPPEYSIIRIKETGCPRNARKSGLMGVVNPEYPIIRINGAFGIFDNPDYGSDATRNAR
jgi:hypothetical protein